MLLTSDYFPEVKYQELGKYDVYHTYSIKELWIDTEADVYYARLIPDFVCKWKEIEDAMLTNLTLDEIWGIAYAISNAVDKL